MKWVKTYKKTILFSLFLLIVSLIKIPSPDDLLNMLWVDVVPIHPTIENSIVSISNTPNVDKYEHCFLYAILAFILWLEVPKKKKWKSYLFIFEYGFTLGLIIECLQAITPHRSFNMMDAVANTCGILIALILIFIISYVYERIRKSLSNSSYATKRSWVYQRQKFNKLLRKC